MGATIVTLGNFFNFLEQGSTLADFVAACLANPYIKKAEIYVMAGPEEIDGNVSEIRVRNLPFSSKAIGLDSHRRTLVEQPPLYLGKIAYPVNDTTFQRPLGFTVIKPLEDLTRYAVESARFVAQHDLKDDFEAISYLRFNPIEDKKEIFRITTKEAKRQRPLPEPSVIYLSK